MKPLIRDGVAICVRECPAFGVCDRQNLGSWCKPWSKGLSARMEEMVQALPRMLDETIAHDGLAYVEFEGGRIHYRTDTRGAVTAIEFVAHGN